MSKAKFLNDPRIRFNHGFWDRRNQGYRPRVYPLPKDKFYRAGYEHGGYIQYQNNDSSDPAWNDFRGTRRNAGIGTELLKSALSSAVGSVVKSRLDKNPDMNRVQIKQRAVNRRDKCYMSYQVYLDGKLYMGGFKTLASAESYVAANLANLAVKSRLDKNPDWGKGFTYHGSYSSLILARRQEREIPGSFIHKSGNRYYVLKPKRIRGNPRTSERGRDFGLPRQRMRSTHFERGDRVRHKKARITGTVDDSSGRMVRVRFDDGETVIVHNTDIVHSTSLRPNLSIRQMTTRYRDSIRKSPGRYRAAMQRSLKRKNPGRGALIYGRVLKIYAVKTSGPYKGQRFVHTFKPGAKLMGLPDGSLAIRH